jgi:dihydrofolate reductase
MRRLVVSMNLTLDGYMAGPAGEMDWHFRYWTDEMGDELSAALYKADCLLFGRVTYCAMMTHLKSLSQPGQVSRADLGFINQVADCQKVVCSKSLLDANWKHSVLLKGDLKKALHNLKNRPGKDIMVYGSGQLVKKLMRIGAVDIFHLWIHPIVLSAGKRLFYKGVKPESWLLLRTKTFNTGVVLVSYDCHHNKKVLNN